MPDACTLPARASQRWGRGGALEPAGQMPNTVKDVVDNEMSKPLML